MLTTTPPDRPPRPASRPCAASWASSPLALCALLITACAATPLPEARLLAQHGEPEAWAATSSTPGRAVVALVPRPVDTADVPGLALAREFVTGASTLAEVLARPADTTHGDAPTDAQRRRADKRTVAVGTVQLVGPGHTEPTAIEVYDAHGEMQLGAVAEFAALIGADDATAVEPRLLAMLYLIGRDFDRPVHLVSGLRPAVAASDYARAHADGHAVDLYLDGVSTTALRDYCHQTFTQVGVGHRPRAGHVHLDVRQTTLHWTDTARPGQQGRERLDPVADTAAQDPTTTSVHLTAAQLYPHDAPPRDSKRADAPEGTPSRKSSKSSKRSSRKYHVVRKGETVVEIARRYGKRPDQIIDWNDLGKAAVIRPGQKLRVRRK